MQWILTALLRNKNFILYLFLLLIGLLFSSYRSSYHNTVLNQFTLGVSGTLNAPVHSARSYFLLQENNRKLMVQNLQLKEELIRYQATKKIDSSPKKDTLSTSFKYRLTPAKIIKNSYNNIRNILLIDKGKMDSLTADMGVVNANGIIGIINQVSTHYASVVSILHVDLKVNAKFKNSGVFGSLGWNGNDPNRMQLTDISVINPVQVGDTIVTGGMSAYFPEELPIGRVIKKEKTEDGGYYALEVELFNNMTDLQEIYVIENTHREELLTLEQNSK